MNFRKISRGGSFSIQKFILQCLSRFYTPGDGDKYLPWLQIQFQVKLRLWSFLKMGSWCVTGGSVTPTLILPLGCSATDEGEIRYSGLFIGTSAAAACVVQYGAVRSQVWDGRKRRGAADH